MIRTDAVMSRQELIIHKDLRNAAVVVAGVGMLGGWSTLALARLAALVCVWDDDVVEDVNSGNQPYNEEMIGLPKVSAIGRLGDGLPIVAYEGKFNTSISRTDIVMHRELSANPDADRKLIVVSGVDSFKARGEVAAWARFQKADLFIDTRALGELAVVCMVPPPLMDKYLSEEIRDDKDVPDVQCGENGTAYVGMNIASKVGTWANAFFKGLPVPYLHVEHLGMADVLRKEMVSEHLPKVVASEPATATA